MALAGRGVALGAGEGGVGAHEGSFRDAWADSQRHTAEHLAAAIPFATEPALGRRKLFVQPCWNTYLPAQKRAVLVVQADAGHFAGPSTQEVAVLDTATHRSELFACQHHLLGA